jgi:TolB-like protein/tetratricopeptide (TPR) repeat protein
MNSDQRSFGPFRLDLGRRELVRDEKPVRLGSRALDILCVLASAEGEVVSKDELMARVWPGTVVEENNIQVHVSALRKVFSEGGDGQTFLVTVPGRGYRLIGLQQAHRTEPDASARVQSMPPPDKPSIAVLPFANMSGDPEQEYFVDGMVEEIITALSKVRWLLVIARNSSFTYKGKTIDVKLVGREVGVRYVLQGSVRKVGQQVRITAQLIDALSGAHLWADRIDGTLHDIFELQDKVASKIVGAIEPRVLSSEVERATRKPTASLDAYDFYLRALSWFHRLTDEGHAEAIRLASQALVLDPSYSPPAAMIGWCRVLQAVQGWVIPSSAEVAQSVALAKQALESGKDDPHVLWMAGFTVVHLAGEHVAGRQAVERALVLNPNCAHAWMVSGFLHCFSNRPDRAIVAIQQAMRLSPLDPLGYMFTHVLAMAHCFARRYEQAMESVERSLSEQPRFLPAVRLKAVLYGYLDRREEGKWWVQQVLDLHPGLTVAGFDAFATTFFSPEVRALYIHGLRRAGLPEE